MSVIKGWDWWHYYNAPIKSCECFKGQSPPQTTEIFSKFEIYLSLVGLPNMDWRWKLNLYCNVKYNKILVFICNRLKKKKKKTNRHLSLAR